MKNINALIVAAVLSLSSFTLVANDDVALTSEQIEAQQQQAAEAAEAQKAMFLELTMTKPCTPYPQCL
jgi:hypothetical protein